MAKSSRKRTVSHELFYDLTEYLKKEAKTLTEKPRSMAWLQRTLKTGCKCTALSPSTIKRAIKVTGVPVQIVGARTPVVTPSANGAMHDPRVPVLARALVDVYAIFEAQGMDVTPLVYQIREIAGSDLQDVQPALFTPDEEATE